MGILALLLLGLICGYIAKALLPGKGPGGLLVTLVLGVAGALLGGWAATALFHTRPLDRFWEPSSWLTAIIGSVALLLLWRLFQGRRHA